MSLRQFVLNLATLPLKLAIFGAWFGLLMLWERFLPAAPQPATMTLARSARVGGNVTLGAINAVLWLVVTLPLTVIAIGYAPERGFMNWRGDWAAGPAGLAVDIVLLDLFAYFWHRASHESEVLWRFHEVHHRDEFLDVTTGLRFHFGEIIFGSAVRAFVVCAMSCPLEHVIVFDLVVLLMNWFSHSNIKLPLWFEKALSYVFVTPWLHWTHHKTTKPESDQNYAVIFSFWDVFLGTRAERGRRIGMEVGLRHDGDLPLGRLLIQPFTGRRD
ncbi:MAG TPA: sterol desaturase family protein [Reyranellaceae bacterium]|nr:sterol desaturase family protein [Reyranellaceae bacterium]